MPAPKSPRKRAYRRQPGTFGDRAFVVVNKRRHYLPGEYNSPESWAEYYRLCAEIAVNGGTLSEPEPEPDIVSVAVLVKRFRDHIITHHAKSPNPDGEPAAYKQALRPVLELYATLPTSDFGPKALKAVRERMIGMGWSRPYINKQVTRIRRVFGWGVSEEIVAPDVAAKLERVEGIRKGRTEARETDPVKPVPQAWIDAVKARVSRQVAAIIDLQLLTAARAGELVIMRPVDIDMTGKVWTYRPSSHKGSWRDQGREIYLGAKAQDVIGPFLTRPVKACLFSPQDAVRDKANEFETHRREGQAPTPRKTTRTIRERYDVDSYRRAIHRACDKAGVPRWGVHRLRHNAATYLKREFGLEAARVILGHRSASMTEHYAEIDRAKAVEVIAKIG